MKTELLAPAGDIEAAYSAFYFGADAIYLGLKHFSARAEATNFSPEELDEITAYAHDHKLMRLPNVVKVFFRYEDDREMERIVDVLESTIEDLQNTRDKKIITELNNYPIVSTRAHTRVFNRRWMNIVSAIILPVGIIIYLRMWRFRLRLYRDLKAIKHANTEIIGRIEELRNNN